MQRAAKTSRFLIDSFSNRGIADSESLANHAEITQYVLSRITHTANSRQVFDELALRLIQVAEHAYSLRDISRIQVTSKVLMGLPTKAARQIGLYYQALALKRKGQTNEAERLFEEVAERAPLVYRARAIQTLGTHYLAKGRPEEALRFQLEALRVASDKNVQNLLVTLLAHLEISYVKSDLGDHQGALDTLVSLSPLVRLVSKEEPLYTYFYHNELAVELGELGHLAEAKVACQVAMASPYARAYPEWAETAQELEAKLVSARSSVIAINRAPEAAAPSNAKRRHEVKPALAFICHERGKQVSISVTITNAGCGATAGCVTSKRAQEFLCDSSQPRAPPTIA